MAELFAYLDEPQTRFAERIFKFLDSSGDGTIDFVEFLKMISTWCMFGPKEVLQFCCSIFDVDGSGSLSVKELKELIVSNEYIPYIMRQESNHIVYRLLWRRPRRHKLKMH